MGAQLTIYFKHTIHIREINTPFRNAKRYKITIITKFSRGILGAITTFEKIGNL